MLFSVQRKKVEVLINTREKKQREGGERQCMGRTYYLFLYYHCSAAVRAVANNMGCLGRRDIWTWSVIFLMVPNILADGHPHDRVVLCIADNTKAHTFEQANEFSTEMAIYIYIYKIFLYLFSVRCLQN